ncbi:hypothetical protein RchiOBHm_Chr5g0077491 [Rosa chinensis]|uniref:Uncharacterized protein n=1 Tax=Rosa chinensis TaxID=74649 RepID=A0A2P6QM25_ROSCH|nr:hypothetical protein RchiOBHm_Chr5g0077491 [Rosa chinensis]
MKQSHEIVDEGNSNKMSRGKTRRRSTCSNHLQHLCVLPEKRKAGHSWSFYFLDLMVDLIKHRVVLCSCRFKFVLYIYRGMLKSKPNH